MIDNILLEYEDGEIYSEDVNKEVKKNEKIHNTKKLSA
jgi:hypothetical protein